MEKIVVDINNQNYDVVINRKIGNKNMYLRVKEDDILYVTCNSFISNRQIINFIKDNEKSVLKMLNRMEKKKEKEEYFYYLGKRYDLVYLNNNGISFGNEKVFVNPSFDLEKWYKKQASVIFKEELDRIYHEYKYSIPYPSLTIRKMKTRWGVCNVKTHKVTLNLELIKKDKIYLDYVIVHELSHLIHANHSKAFWQCVEDNFKDYKKVRKELKNDA